jgi:hypothetical protein
MVGLVLAANVSQAICTAVELGLPQALAEGPRSVDELAEECGAQRRQLARLMRVLAAYEVFARVGSSYELTPLGRTLLVDEEDGRSVAGMALFAGSGWLAEARAASPSRC